MSASDYSHRSRRSHKSVRPGPDNQVMILPSVSSAASSSGSLTIGPNTHRGSLDGRRPGTTLSSAYSSSQSPSYALPPSSGFSDPRGVLWQQTTVTKQEVTSFGDDVAGTYFNGSLTTEFKNGRPVHKESKFEGAQLRNGRWEPGLNPEDLPDFIKSFNELAVEEKSQPPSHEYRTIEVSPGHNTPPASDNGSSYGHVSRGSHSAGASYDDRYRAPSQASGSRRRPVVPDQDVHYNNFHSHRAPSTSSFSRHDRGPWSPDQLEKQQSVQKVDAWDNTTSGIDPDNMSAASRWTAGTGGLGPEDSNSVASQTANERWRMEQRKGAARQSTRGDWGNERAPGKKRHKKKEKEEPWDTASLLSAGTAKTRSTTRSEIKRLEELQRWQRAQERKGNLYNPR